MSFQDLMEERPPVAYRRLVLHALFICGALSLVVWAPEYLLFTQGRATRGEVVAVLPHEHGGALNVRFDAGGSRQLARRIPPGEGNPAFETIGVGDSIVVTYVPWAPQMATGGIAQNTALETALGITLGGTAIAIVLGFLRFVVFVPRRRWTTDRPAQVRKEP